MEIIIFFWTQWLYIPLYNFLIWLYIGLANYNLGIAIILLTIVLRIILLPFTFLVERGKKIALEMHAEVAEIQKDFANDPVQRKLAVRQYLKKKKIRHWAKAVVLGVQGLLLVLLYQVFVGGTSADAQLHLVYPLLPRPDFINTMFMGIDLAHRNLWFSAIVAGYLFAEILLDNYFNQSEMTRKNALYMIFFPAFTFLILALLPSVKSLFILTSLVISTIITAGFIIIRAMRNKNKIAA